MSSSQMVGEVEKHITSEREKADQLLIGQYQELAELDSIIEHLEVNRDELVTLENVSAGRSPEPKAQRQQQTASPRAPKASREERLLKILGHVRTRQGSATQGSIMEAVELTQPQVQQLVAQLMGEGYVRAETNPENRRQKLIDITTKGGIAFEVSSFEPQSVFE